MSIAAIKEQLFRGENEFNAQYKALSAELQSLKFQLEDLIISNNREVEELEFANEHELANAALNQEVRRKQLMNTISMLQNAPEPAGNSNWSLRALQEENSQLRFEVERLDSEKRYTEERASVLTMSELRPLQQALQDSQIAQKQDLEVKNTVFNDERETLERKNQALEREIANLKQELGQVNDQVRTADEENFLAVRDLRRKVDDVCNDIDYYQVNNRYLTKESKETSSEKIGFSEQTSQISAELSRLKELNAELKPQAKYLEGLVYGKGISPKKPKKKTKN